MAPHRRRTGSVDGVGERIAARHGDDAVVRYVGDATAEPDPFGGGSDSVVERLLHRWQIEDHFFGEDPQ